MADELDALLDEVEGELNAEQARLAAPEPPSRGASAARGAVQGATAAMSDEVVGKTAEVGSRLDAQAKASLKLIVPGPRALAKTYPGLPYPEAQARWRQEELEGRGYANLDEAAQAADRAYLDPAHAARGREVRDAERERNASARGAHPGYYVAGEVAGSIPTAMAIPAPVRGAGLGTRSAQAAAAGAGYGGLVGFGASEAESGGGQALDAAGGAAIGAALGPAIEVGLAGASRVAAPVREWLAAKLGRAAETQALKATGATQVDFKRLARENENRPQQVGRALLEEEGIKLRGPHAVRDTTRAIRRDYGQEIGAITKMADDTGWMIDLGAIAARAQKEVLEPLRADPLQKATAEKVATYLGDLIQKAGPEGGVTPSQAHAIRKQLDLFLRGVRKAQDPDSTFTKGAINDIRGIVDDEIDSTMKQAGLGDAWSEANAGFAAMADAGKLAQKGVERAEGNNSPLTALTATIWGSGGAAAGAAAGGPLGAALGGALGAGGRAAMIKYGPAVAARVADRLSKTLQTNPAALGPYAAPLAAMAEKRGPQGLAAAYYVLVNRDPSAKALLEPVLAGEAEDTGMRVGVPSAAAEESAR